jgi:hypothetical protein
VALVGLLAIVGVAGALVLPQFLASKPTQTVWQSITSGISDGAVPKQTALEAFAYLFKVDIPGVTVPQGRDGGDAPTSGSGAMRWVRANWDGLTADQKAVVNRYLVPGPNDQMVPLNLRGTAPTAAPSAAALASPSGVAVHPQFQLLSARKSLPIPVQAAPGAPITLADAMANELAADIAHIGPRLGIPVIGVTNKAFPEISLDLSPTDGGSVLFVTNALGDDFGHYAPCTITAFKAAWQGETVTGSGGVSPRLHVLITHEVVHCYQNVVFGDVPTALSIAPWITEGTAIYLAADDTGIAEPTLPGAWELGYFNPELALTNRTYDAVGYYAFLAHQGRNLWSLMLPAWQAAAKPGLRSNAFIAVLQGDAPDIRNNWAESYLRQPDWGDPWIAYGFGLPDAAQAYRHPAQAQPAPGWEGTLLSRSNTVLNVNATSGEVVTITTDGLAGVHDSGGNSDLAFQAERFCTIPEGCGRPQGTLEAGTNVAPKQMTIPFVAAFNAPSGGSKYSVASDKLDDLCKRSPTPQPTQASSSCGPNCSNSNGDPHLLTVNGYAYDFQAAGEFTLLRSSDGSLEIQARQEPWSVDQRHVAVNTAVAARVGSHRIAIYSTGGGLQARVDGTAVDLKSPMDLGGGGRISTYASDLPGFEVDFPDGTKMWAIGASAIDLEISPSVPLQTSGVGLLSRVVPGGLGVPAMPDGTRLPAAADKQARHDVLYGKYADAWRVTESTTLFDYDAGKSTATYTIEGYPAYADDIPAADLTAAQTAAGTSACAGITDSGLHGDCVFDVGVTGDSSFAETYKATQILFDSGIAKATPAPVVALTPQASGAVTGALQVVQGTRLGGFALGPDNMLYISVEISSTHSILVEVDPTTGKIVHQVDVPALTDVHVAGGSVWLPGLVTDTNGDRCSVTRFDASTLAQGATIALPCSPQTPQIASDGSAIWFVDTTKYDVSSKKGAVLTRIDPTTNALGPSVALPSDSGSLKDSQGAIFFLDQGSDKGDYRLTSGASAMESFGQLSTQPVVPAGTGLWVTGADGQSVQYFAAAGTPQVTLPMSGKLVAGDTTAAYIDVAGQDSTGTRASEQLWRFPMDGSTPSLLAYSPTVNGENYPYYSAYQPLPVANGNGVAVVLSVNVSGSPTPWVILQWIPTK